MQSKRFLSAFLSFSSLNFLAPALGILLLPLYLRFLSPEEYGIFSLITVVSGILCSVANFKLDTALRTFYFDLNSQKEKLIYTKQIISLGFYAVLLYALFVIPFSYFFYQFQFSDSNISFYPLGLISIITALINQAISSLFVYLQNELKLKEFSLLKLTGILSTVILQLVFITQLELGIKGIIIANLFATILQTSIILVRYNHLIALAPSLNNITPSLKFSLPLIPLTFLLCFEGRIDRLVLEDLLRITDVGVYAMLMTLVGMSNWAFNALDNSIRPFLYSQINEKQSSLAINQHLLLYTSISCLGFSGIITIASNIHWITSNNAYLAIKDLAVLACVATLPLLFTRFYALLYLYQKRSAMLTTIYIFKFIATVGLFYLCVPIFGLKGALLATLCAQVINMVIFYIFTKSRYDFLSIPYQSLLTVAVFIIITTLAPYTIKINATGLYGTLQLVIMLTVLFLLNYKTLSQSGYFSTLTMKSGE